jgi:hypothetical protein
MDGAYRNPDCTVRTVRCRRAGCLWRLGPALYIDDDGTVVHVEDNVGLIEHCKKAYELTGLGEDFVDQFIR